MQYSLLRRQDYTQMPWKNGKGYTDEIAKNSEHCADGRFNWRISMATIEQNGPFSHFIGYQRVISVLEGEGIQLTIEGESNGKLLKFVPFFFSGESQTECALLSDPVKDFNLIYDAKKHHATCQWINSSTPKSFSSNADVIFIFCATELTITSPCFHEQLAQYDSLLINNDHQSVQLELIPKSNASDNAYCLIQMTNIE